MDMVERVARAIFKALYPHEEWNEFAERDTIRGKKHPMVEHAFVLARAAIAAMSEPTEGMADAFCKAWRNPAFHGTDTQAIALGISAMIDAALTSSEKP